MSRSSSHGGGGRGGRRKRGEEKLTILCDQRIFVLVPVTAKQKNL